MPPGILSEAGEGPSVGLLGKLPLAGDFVARGLPDTFRLRWDEWMARHLAPRAPPWPMCGLRLLIAAGPERAVLGVVVPSRDAAGRGFPLSALAFLSVAPSRERADAWCDGAAALLRKAAEARLDADALWDALLALPPPGPADPVPLLLWTGGEALAAPPDSPEAALDALLGARPEAAAPVSSRGSSTP